MRLLGGDDTLKETFAAGIRLNVFRASQLADELGTTAQNVNNRLKRLLDAGSLVRTCQDSPAGGREFRPCSRIPEGHHHPPKQKVLR